MELSESGEARVRGYLYVIRQSLRSFLPHEVVADALRELESHIRERIDSSEAEPDERRALERLLAELGQPLRVAQAYSAEMIIEEAVTTGRVAPTARAMWHLASTTFLGFFATLGLSVGYLVGSGFVLIATLKPIFPGNVGVMLIDGAPRGFGAFGQIPAEAEMWGGYWIVPVSIAVGLAVLVATHRSTTRFIGWWRETRRESSYPGV